MHALWVMLFSIASGFTASAIIANLYRISGMKAETTGARAFRSAVLVVAGPSVLFETAMQGFIAKTWRPISFWLSAALVLYWSLGLGLLVLEIAIHIAPMN
jgi:hypothetical protein